MEQILVPALKAGDIVVMDKLSSHKVTDVNETREAAKAKVVYRPPYRPDFNPIEQVENIGAKVESANRRETREQTRKTLQRVFAE
jgi:transposase